MPRKEDAVIHCDNKLCEYNVSGEHCDARNVYYVNRLCMTFRKATQAPVKELMRQQSCNCEPTDRGYRAVHRRVFK